MLHSQASNQHRHKFENADNYKGQPPTKEDTNEEI